ncbi:NaeI very short patch repair endonuclease (V.NaeI) [Propionibacterium freudenreichii]|nr:NaeI very short patch repair endonuclease (V.NaeI) [Propionibacterium freudenreichii]CEI32466.1 NaeI very short patch repair endonuclease (V.NaeI) [Propionibacterium freudenreichii]
MMRSLSRKSPPASSAATRAKMQGNRRRDTKPELELRHLLHALGYRYRVDFPIRLDGVRPRPDIVFTKNRVAVFVDGCFWHGCPKHFHMPKVHTDFWQAKIARNRARDERDTLALEAANWTVIRIWEHEPTSQALADVLEELPPRH